MDESTLNDLSQAPVRVVIRYYSPEQDQPFIYATWRSSSFYGTLNPIKMNPDKYFKDQTAKIKNILKNAIVKIACLEDDPQFIVGYSVSTDNHLDWIYVKADYRCKGIGTVLMPKNIKTVTDQYTKIGNTIAIKKNFKENLHGRREEEAQTQ